uniref:Uncharacterized protein n=1 Tax=Globodera rostochiensis TaxID=31243 RepID=A0A914GYG6_GLORO
MFISCKLFLIRKLDQQNGQLPEPVTQNECSGQSCKSSVGEQFDEAVPVASNNATTIDCSSPYCCNNELKQAMKDAYESAGVANSECSLRSETTTEEEQQQREGERCGGDEQKRGPELDEDYHLAEEGSGGDGTKNSE